MTAIEREARALARKDYFDGKVNTTDYPTVERYEEEWWEERYLPLVQQVSMTFDHYMKFVLAGVSLHRHGDTYRERLMLASMGLGGEAGEVCDHGKKVAFHGAEMHREALIKELGDVLWYYALMLDTNSITLDEVMHANVLKLCDRYPHRHGRPEEILAGHSV
ncbi:MAG: nucleoside triphosphate pyrophosphohydrolase family protein [Dehalococcoidia bacterium]